MNILYSTRHRFFVHIIIYSIIICFLYENFVWAQGVQATNPRSLTPVVSKLIPSLSQLTIPENFGRIEDSFKGSSPKVILHIRDSHVNYEAQANYIKILDDLYNNQLPNGKKLIGIEGAAGELTAIGFRSIPNERIKKIISGHFLKNGYLNGAEYFSIFSPEEPVLYGVEDPDLYRENLSVFRKVQGAKKDLLAYINMLQQRLDSVIDDIFSGKALEFFKKVGDYNEHRIEIADYIELLKDYAGRYGLPIRNYPTIFTSARLVKMEKRISVKKVSEEREELMKDLEKVLVKEEFGGLVKNALLYRLGKMRMHDFYSYLGRVMDIPGVSVLRYPNLTKYIRLCSMYQYVNAELLFKEAKNLEEALKKKMFTKDVEWEVDRLYVYMRVVRNLLNLQLTVEELKFYRENLATMGLSSFGKEVNAVLEQYGRATVAIPDFGNADFGIFERFYDLALERDKVIIKNMLEEMDKKGIDVGVLVTGGFHTSGIKEQLLSKDISYVVISPSITKMPTGDLYLNIMMGEKTPFEKMLAYTGKRLAPPVSATVPPGGICLGDRSRREGLLRMLVELVVALKGYDEGRIKGVRAVETGCKRLVTQWKQRAEGIIEGEVQVGLSNGILWHTFEDNGKRFYSAVGINGDGQKILQERLSARNDISKEEIEVEKGKKVAVWFMPKEVFHMFGGAMGERKDKDRRAEKIQTVRESLEDMAGEKAEDSDKVIQQLIQTKDVVEVVYRPTAAGEAVPSEIASATPRNDRLAPKLAAYKVKWVDGYEPGKTAVSEYKGDDVEIDGLFTKDEQRRLIEWMDTHRIDGAPVKFRMVMGEVALGWKDDVEHSNISHAGYRDRCIYIGDGLLRSLFSSDNDPLRTEVLDNDELRHLQDKDFDHSGEMDAYRERVAGVGSRCEKILWWQNEVVLPFLEAAGVDFEKMKDKIDPLKAQIIPIVINKDKISELKAIFKTQALYQRFNEEALGTMLLLVDKGRPVALLLPELPEFGGFGGIMFDVVFLGEIKYSATLEDFVKQKVNEYVRRLILAILRSGPLQVEVEHKGGVDKIALTDGTLSSTRILRIIRKYKIKDLAYDFIGLPGVYFNGEVAQEYGDFIGEQTEEMEGEVSLLDAGTGTGVLGLIAAQKGARVVAIDDNPVAVRNAVVNAGLAGLTADRYKVFRSDLVNGNLADEKFNIIVSFPPVYLGDEYGYPVSIQDEYDRARYDPKGEFLEALMRKSGQVLSSDGKLIVLYHTGHEALLVTMAERYGFNLSLIKTSRVEGYKGFGYYVFTAKKLGGGVSAEVQEVRDSLKDVLQKSAGVTKSVPDNSTVMKDVLEADLREPIERFFKALLAAEGKTDSAHFVPMVDHYICLFTSLMQLAKKAQFTDDSSKQQQLLLLGEGVRKARFDENMARLDGLYNEELYKWIVILLLHDIGKFRNPAAHDSESFNEINEFGLFDVVDTWMRDMGLQPFSANTKDKILLAVKYHIHLGLIGSGQYTPRIISEILNDKIVKQMVAEKPEDKTKILKEILGDITLITALDVASATQKGIGDKGFLRVHLLELYFEVIDSFIEGISEGRDENTVLEELARKMVLVKLAIGISMYDNNLTSHFGREGTIEEKYKFYIDKIMAAKQKAVDSGIINAADWEQLLNFLAGEETMGWVDVFVRLAWLNDKGTSFGKMRNVASSSKINPKVFKYMKFIVQLRAQGQFGTSAFNRIVIYAEPGVWLNRAENQAGLLNILLANIDRFSKLIPGDRENRYYLADAQGNRIGSSYAEVSKTAGHLIFVVKNPEDEQLQREPQRAKTSGVGMKVSGELKVLVSGSLSDIVSWLNTKYRGLSYGNKFAQIFRAALSKHQGILSEEELIIRFVEGNENLMQVEENVVVIDIDIFDEGRGYFDFGPILYTELASEEFKHLAWRKKGYEIPLALEEIITDYLKLAQISLDKDERVAEILLALMLDNDIDDHEFFISIAHVLPKAKLAQVIEILKHKVAILPEDISARINELTGILERQPEIITYDMMIQEAVRYASKEGVYGNGVKEYLRARSFEQIISGVKKWLIKLKEIDKGLANEMLEDMKNNFYCDWNYKLQELFEAIESYQWQWLTDKRDLCSWDRFKEAAYKYYEYMEAESTWFKEKYPEYKDHTIAYFSMEYGIKSLRTYGGGLGILAGDHMRAASDLGVPIVGVGLLYKYGYFKQKMSQDGWQMENYEQLDYSILPLEPVLDKGGEELIIPVELPSPNRTVYVKVWQVRVGRNKILYLDTNLQQNSLWDRDITNMLYRGKGTWEQLVQEYILGIAGVRALKAIGINPSVYHLNEGHAVLAVFEIIKNLMEEKGISFQEAKEAVKKMVGYTNHTIVEAGNEAFPVDYIKKYFGEYCQKLGLDIDKDIISLAQRDGMMDFTWLAMQMSDYRNGVSQVHGDVLRNIWAGYGFSEREIDAITNGAHREYWMSHELQKLIEEKGGLASVGDKELWEVHRERKTLMINKLKELGVRDSEKLDANKFTIVWSRRFAPYKHPEKLFENIDRLKTLLEQGVQIIFAGKSHPMDEPGKRLIQRIHQFSRQYPGQVVFVENYDLNISPYLVSGADLWLNTPEPPQEASGTSGMKALFNGVPSLSTRDGWCAEGIVHGENGWLFDYNNMGEMYNLLTDILRLYKKGSKAGVPTEWVGIMRNCIMSAEKNYDMRLVVQKYVEKMYKKLIDNTKQNVMAEPEKVTSGIKRSVRTGQEPIEIMSIKFDANAQPVVESVSDIEGVIFDASMNMINVSGKSYTINPLMMKNWRDTGVERIKVVAGNTELATITGNMLVIDIDVLETKADGELVCKELLDWELEEELGHLYRRNMQARSPPELVEFQAIDEIWTDIEKIALFNSYPAEAQNRILTRLRLDNDIDDKDFAEVLERSLAKPEGLDLLTYYLILAKGYGSKEGVYPASVGDYIGRISVAELIAKINELQRLLLKQLQARGNIPAMYIAGEFCTGISKIFGEYWSDGRKAYIFFGGKKEVKITDPNYGEMVWYLDRFDEMLGVGLYRKYRFADEIEAERIARQGLGPVARNIGYRRMMELFKDRIKGTLKDGTTASVTGNYKWAQSADFPSSPYKEKFGTYTFVIFPREGLKFKTVMRSSVFHRPDLGEPEEYITEDNIGYNDALLVKDIEEYNLLKGRIGITRKEALQILGRTDEEQREWENRVYEESVVNSGGNVRTDSLTDIELNPLYIDLVYERARSVIEEGMLLHIKAENASEVLLTGDFIGWAQNKEDGALRAHKINSDTWAVIVPKDLMQSAKRYEFKFIVTENKQKSWRTGLYSGTSTGDNNSEITISGQETYFSREKARQKLHAIANHASNNDIKKLAEHRLNRLGSAWGFNSMVYISPEVTPFSKAGGLADVAGEYPQAMAELGIESTVITMLYKKDRDKIIKKYGLVDIGQEITIPIGKEAVKAKVMKAKVGKVTVYFLVNDGFTDALYGDVAIPKKAVEKTVFLSRGALELIKLLKLSPDIIHSNDWMAGLVPVLMRTDPEYSEDPILSEARTIHSLHNVGYAYQGVFRYELEDGMNLFNLLGLDATHCDGIRDPNDIRNMNFTAGAIYHCDLLSTVSETYAKELEQPEFAQGLQEMIKDKRSSFSGIPNGLDVEGCKARYVRQAENKQEAKEKLQRRLGLEVDPNVPVIGMVTRIAYQKGVDLVLANLERMVNELDVQFVFVGNAARDDVNGKKIEEGLIELSRKYPGKIGVMPKFDTELADLIYIGSDMFLAPSLYEPCGLTQMMAMVAGTIPIVRATGGLEDTVQNYNLETRIGNGIKFKEYDAEVLYTAIKRAVDLYRNEPSHWVKLQQNALETDVSWRRAARQYIKLYQKMLGIPTMEERIQADLIDVLHNLESMQEVDITSLPAFVHENFYDVLKDMFKSSGLLSRDSLDEQAEEFIDSITRHMENVLIGLLQLRYSAPTEKPTVTTHVWRLFESGDMARGLGNYQKIQQIYLRNAMQYAVIAILHDIGKVEEYFSRGRIKHETESRILVKELKLLEVVNDYLARHGTPIFTKDDMRKIGLIVMFHMHTGLINTGENPFSKMNDIFVEKRTRRYLDDGRGKVSPEKLMSLLEGIVVISSLDVAGFASKERTGGYLLNPKAESQLGIIEEIISVATQSNFDFEKTVKAIKELSKRLTLSRVALLSALVDKKIDVRIKPAERGVPKNGSYNFYIGKLESAKQRLIDKGEITAADWDLVLERFDDIGCRFFNYPYTWLTWLDTESNVDTAKSGMKSRAENIEDSMEVNPQALKFLSYLVRAAQTEGFGINSYEVFLTDENRVNFYINRSDVADYIINLNQALRQAKGIVYREEEGKNRIYFVDQDGHEIRDGPVMEKEGARLFVKLSKKEITVTTPKGPVGGDLKSRIISRIHENGERITYAEFMNFALKDSQEGYYSAGIAKFDRYTTSGATFATDSMEPNFAVGLAKQFYSMWELMGKPDKFDIVEMGAGDGTLCLNTLNEIQKLMPDFYNAVRYTIVEISPALVDRQKEKLADHKARVNWKLQSAGSEMFQKNEISGVFISNELVDAFNTHRIIYDEDANKLQEIYVGYDSVKREFYEIVGDVSSERITEYMQVIYDQTGRHPARGTEVAVCLEMVDWIKNIAGALNRGFIITFDYGHSEWTELLTAGAPSVYNYGLPVPRSLMLGRDLTFHVDFPSLDWYGSRNGLRQEWFGDAGNYMSRFSNMSRVSSSYALIQSKGVSGYTIGTSANQGDIRSAIKDILGYLKTIGLQKGNLPGISLEGNIGVNDIIDGLVSTANESESSAEEVLMNLIAKGEGMEGYIRQAMNVLRVVEPNRSKLNAIIDKAGKIKQAEEQALVELAVIARSVATKQSPVGATAIMRGINVGIIDAHALLGMRENEARQVLDTLSRDNNKAIAVVIFDKADEGVLRVVDTSRVTVVKAEEFGGRLPEVAAIDKIKAEKFGGKEVEIDNISVLASLENIVKGRWRVALSNFHYVILNNKSLTNTAILNMYKELPEDVKAYLTQAGLGVEVIKRSTLQEEKFEPARYEKNAVTEIGKAA